MAESSHSLNASSKVSAGNRWKGRVFVLPVEVDKAEFTRRFNKVVGSVVSAICRDRDLKQKDTALLLRVSPRTVRRLERGQAPYTLIQLELIARETKTTTIEILQAINNFPSVEQSARKRKNNK